jgi:hypothetical protein
MAYVQLSRVCEGVRFYYVTSRRWGPGELVHRDAARAYDDAGQLVAAYAEPEDRAEGPWDDSRERELRAAVEAHARGLAAEQPGLVLRWRRRGRA